jgi:hypothetical protein
MVGLAFGCGAPGCPVATRPLSSCRRPFRIDSKGPRSRSLVPVGLKSCNGHLTWRDHVVCAAGGEWSPASQDSKGGLTWGSLSCRRRGGPNRQFGRDGSAAPGRYPGIVRPEWVVSSFRELFAHAISQVAAGIEASGWPVARGVWWRSWTFVGSVAEAVHEYLVTSADGPVEQGFGAGCRNAASRSPGDRFAARRVSARTVVEAEGRGRPGPGQSETGGRAPSRS